MIITSIKTHKITTDDDIFKILDKHLKSLKEKSILVITSKIISICQGRVVKIGKVSKKDLVIKEADYYLSATNQWNYILTLKDNLLISSAGIDESNGKGYYILWPENPQQVVNQIWEYLKKRFALKKVGVIITDSRSTPLRRGTTGLSLAHCGFLSLKDYHNKPDIFGHLLKVTKVDLPDSLAVAAVVLMGEGNEQTPVAKIEELPFVEFTNSIPSDEELKEFHVKIEDDFFAELITSVKWRKGGRKRD